jgi:multiple antibiotic resistance protein
VTALSATAILLLIMDPFGNMVTINTLLAELPPAKRRRIILREALIAYGVLLGFLLGGNQLLSFFGVDATALRISGGIVLFLIALGMVFPDRAAMPTSLEAEPLIVPIAMPLIAGPSAIAALLVFAKGDPDLMGRWFVALTLATVISGSILWISPWLFQRLGQRGCPGGRAPDGYVADYFVGADDARWHRPVPWGLEMQHRQQRQRYIHDLNHWGG